MTRKASRQLLMGLMVLPLLLPTWAGAQDNAEAPLVFSREELVQMLAPIALYPDPLLVEVLMAATYPVEVADAARWVKENPGLRGDDLAGAVAPLGWDPSVKSLVNFPTVLAQMSDNLDWTQRLGDAFLGQQEEVMDVIQNLRERAYAEGYLQTTDQQVVSVEDDTIVIEPANPDMIYVPVYDPFVVFGPGWYSGYPPYVFYPPDYFLGRSVFFFGDAFLLGPCWGYAWGEFDWHRHRCFIDIRRHLALNRHIDRRPFVAELGLGPEGRGPWHHSPAHRREVPYRSPAVEEQFGPATPPGVEERRIYRGHVPEGAAGRAPEAGPGRLAPPEGATPEREGVPGPSFERRGPVFPAPRQEAPERGTPFVTPRGEMPEGMRFAPEPREWGSPGRTASPFERPRSAFDRMDRNGPAEETSRMRGMESGRSMSAPRQSAAPRSMSPPGGGYRGGGRPYGEEGRRR